MADLIETFDGKSVLEMSYPKAIQEKLHLRIKAFNYEMPKMAVITKSEINPTSQKETPVEVKMKIDKQVEINLYIPGGIGDSMNAKWQDESVVSVSSGKDVMTAIQTGKGLSDAALGFGKDVLDSAKTVGARVVLDKISSFGGSLLGDAVNIGASLAANTGQVLAPNRMLTYSGTDFMEIQLPFEFAPKNKDELIAMENIINFFRQASRPSRDTTLTVPVFKYPPIFDIAFVKPVKVDTQNAISFNSSMFFTYKSMALTNFNVTFGNNHDSMTYFNTDSSDTQFQPTDARMNLTFKSLFVSVQSGVGSNN